MPRAAREKSSTGIYHIMIRGINRQNIFEDDEDRERFVDTIARYKKETDFKLYAYCLMNNHVHLLVKENKIELSKIMKRIGTSYAYYFNWKYGRNGHLFQDRYKSEVIENDAYFNIAIRYIHQNPVKAGISKMNEYKWSSYNCYIKGEGILDKGFFLNMLSNDRDLAIKKYIDFMNEPNKDECLEIDERIRLTDEKVRNIIKEIGKLEDISGIKNLDTVIRNKILRKAKEIEGISVLQISRVTGINRAVIIKS